MATLHPVIEQVAYDIAKRSKPHRDEYLSRTRRNYEKLQEQTARTRLGCPNQAHASAGCDTHAKALLAEGKVPNIGIVTAYNDMLSAHKPYETYPGKIRSAANKFGATAQVAGGAPAMCDGITQGTNGMQLSLFSRDIIAQAAGVALSHGVYDGAIYLGICDKIVPGLLRAALSFGHLPSIFIPAGPMPSGISNDKKGQVRKATASELRRLLELDLPAAEKAEKRKVLNGQLLKSEMDAYHTEGTCTFYGTANTNQMLMEVMGLHLPGASFVPPNDPLRDALTEAAVRRVLELNTPIGEIISVNTIVNGLVGLFATGGSTNLKLHFPAFAAAAGIHLIDDDFDRISKVTPQLVSIYPNGKGDINHFHEAGGTSFLIRELLHGGYLNPDVKTVAGDFSIHYCEEPYLTQKIPANDTPLPILNNSVLKWRPGTHESLNSDALRDLDNPFSPEGGMISIKGNIEGQDILGTVKTSALKDNNRFIEAEVRVFDAPEHVQAAFDKGDLDDMSVIVLVRFQGPRANGMPELHKLTEPLAILQDRGQDKGYQVALLTDGRLSGASGKLLGGIHLQPEAAIPGSPLARIQDGDFMRIDSINGTIEMIGVDEREFRARPEATLPPDSFDPTWSGLFDLMRNHAGLPTQGGLPDVSWPFNKPPRQMPPEAKSQPALQLAI